MFTLEPYRTQQSRHTCPSCGADRDFVRYIDEKGHHLDDHVGRCNRESKCGYHYPPRQYFADNPHARRQQSSHSALTFRVESRSTRPLETIPQEHLVATLGRYELNAFVQFLLNMFPDGAQRAVSEYLLGTDVRGRTVFWQIDRLGRIRTGKVIAYDDATGKRLKSIRPSWVHSELVRRGALGVGFEPHQCFFGEHLLSKYEDRPVGIVESEKTAAICSANDDLFRDMIWLASGGKSNLTVESLAGIGSERTIVLFPDADGYHKWNDIAGAGQQLGLDIRVSNLIESLAAPSERDGGFDLADYLIRQERLGDSTT